MRDNFPGRVTRSRKKSSRLPCEKVQLKKFRSQRGSKPDVRALEKDFRAKRPLANVRRRGPACTRFRQDDDDSRISHRTSLQWTPLFFTHDREPRGGLRPPRSLARNPVLSGGDL